MKLIGNHKKTMEKAQTKEEPKDTIMKAGGLLDDDTLENVAGGYRDPDDVQKLPNLADKYGFIDDESVKIFL